MLERINCPVCHSYVPTESVDLATGMTRCPNCQSLLRLQVREERETPEEAAPKQEIYAIPKGIEMLRLPSELSLDMQWRHSVSFSKPQMFVAISYFSILVTFLYIALTTRSFHVIGIIGLFAVIGAALLMWLLASLFNTTYITVDSEFVCIEHRPFKLLYREYKIPIKDIEQLYVKEYVTGRVNSEVYTAHAIMMKVKGQNRDVRLLRGINKPLQAQFIEQEIERFAEIEDKPVKGEFRA